MMENDLRGVLLSEINPGNKGGERKKKSLLAALVMVLFLTLTSVVYFAEEALTPEKISGI
jgi:hypothetical protein